MVVYIKKDTNHRGKHMRLFSMCECVSLYTLIHHTIHSHTHTHIRKERERERVRKKKRKKRRKRREKEEERERKNLESSPQSR